MRKAGSHSGDLPFLPSRSIALKQPGWVTVLLCQVDLRNPEPGSRSPVGLPPGRHMICLVRLAGFQHRPCGPRHPVRQRHRRHVLVTPLQQTLQPPAATVRLLLPGSMGNHHPGAMDQQAAQIPVAAFRDPQQPVLPPGRVLPRYQAEPGRALPTVAEHARIPHGGQQHGGRHRAHPGDRHQQLRLLVLPGYLLNHPVVFLHPPVHVHQLVVQLRQHIQEPGWQGDVGRAAVAQDLRHRRPDPPAALGNLDAVLGQQAADRIRVGRPVPHRPGTDPVNGLLRLPVRALDSDEAHVRPLDRLADHLGVRPVVLVGLDVRFRELRGHELRLMPHGQDVPAPLVGTAAGLHAHHAGRQVGQIFLQLRRLQLPVNAGAARRVDAVDMDRVLRQVDADVRGSGFGFRGMFRLGHGSFLECVNDGKIIVAP